MLVEQQQQLDEQKMNMQQKGLDEKTEIIAEAWQNLTKMREGMEAVKKQEIEKLVNQINEVGKGCYWRHCLNEALCY